MKTAKQLERYCKGVAHHRRIAILMVVGKHDGISLDEIAEELGATFRNTSQHTHRLVRAGLLNKQYRGRRVSHSLSPFGKAFLRFLQTFK